MSLRRLGELPLKILKMRIPKNTKGRRIITSPLRCFQNDNFNKLEKIAQQVYKYCSKKGGEEY